MRPRTSTRGWPLQHRRPAGRRGTVAKYQDWGTRHLENFKARWSPRPVSIHRCAHLKAGHFAACREGLDRLRPGLVAVHQSLAGAAERPDVVHLDTGAPRRGHQQLPIIELETRNPDRRVRELEVLDPRGRPNIPQRNNAGGTRGEHRAVLGDLGEGAAAAAAAIGTKAQIMRWVRRRQGEGQEGRREGGRARDREIRAELQTIWRAPWLQCRARRNSGALGITSLSSRT